jgi:hypothetical protein
MARTASGQVIDFAAIRRARQVENQAVDMVAAWEGRRAQLTGQAELVAREIAAHAEALDDALARFRDFGRAAIRRLGEIQRQIDDINTAIDHWRAHAAASDGDGGGGLSNEAITWCERGASGQGPEGRAVLPGGPGEQPCRRDWTCFPSIADIMDWTDYSRAAVERNLQLLWREGYISRKRRRRADGSFGIYDYTLHRGAEHRAALKASRAAVEDIDEAMEDGVEGEAAPACQISFPARTTRHFAAWATPHFGRRHAAKQVSPCGKMRGQEEPSREPSREPSPGARDLAALFGELEAAVPARVLKFTDRAGRSRPSATRRPWGSRSSSWPGAPGGWRLTRSSGRASSPPPLEDWIAKGQWRGWSGDGAGAEAAGPAPAGAWPCRPRSWRGSWLGGSRGGRLVPAALRLRAGSAGPAAGRTSMALKWLQAPAGGARGFGVGG